MYILTGAGYSATCHFNTVHNLTGVFTVQPACQLKVMQLMQPIITVRPTCVLPLAHNVCKVRLYCHIQYFELATSRDCCQCLLSYFVCCLSKGLAH